MGYKWKDHGYKYFDLEWLKSLFFLAGIVAIVAAVVLVIGTPLYKYSQFEGPINTHYQQAKQAATPEQFASSLRSLDTSLGDSGMNEGSVDFPWWDGDQDTMEFKRNVYLSLAERADALPNDNLGAVALSVGLDELKSSLERTPTNTYGYWVFNQGGIWWQIWLPLILLAGAVVGFIISATIPDYIRWRSGATPAPTS